MKFTFGNTLICKGMLELGPTVDDLTHHPLSLSTDAEAAKAVAYHPDIKMRCITLDGDVYEPGATITGGSAPQSSDLLLRLSKLAELETKLAELKEEYAHVSEEATRFQRVVDQLKQLDAQGRKMEHEFTNLKNLMNESSAGQVDRRRSC